MVHFVAPDLNMTETFAADLTAIQASKLRCTPES